MSIAFHYDNLKIFPWSAQPQAALLQAIGNAFERSFSKIELESSPLKNTNGIPSMSEAEAATRLGNDFNLTPVSNPLYVHVVNILLILKGYTEAKKQAMYWKRFTFRSNGCQELLCLTVAQGYRRILDSEISEKTVTTVHRLSDFLNSVLAELSNQSNSDLPSLGDDGLAQTIQNVKSVTASISKFLKAKISETTVSNKLEGVYLVGRQLFEVLFTLLPKLCSDEPVPISSVFNFSVSSVSKPIHDWHSLEKSYCIAVAHSAPVIELFHLTTEPLPRMFDVADQQVAAEAKKRSARKSASGLLEAHEVKFLRATIHPLFAKLPVLAELIIFCKELRFAYAYLGEANILGTHFQDLTFRIVDSLMKTVQEIFGAPCAKAFDVHQQLYEKIKNRQSSNEVIWSKIFCSMSKLHNEVFAPREREETLIASFRQHCASVKDLLTQDSSVVRQKVAERLHRLCSAVDDIFTANEAWLPDAALVRNCLAQRPVVQASERKVPSVLLSPAAGDSDKPAPLQLFQSEPLYLQHDASWTHAVFALSPDGTMLAAVACQRAAKTVALEILYCNSPERTDKSVALVVDAETIDDIIAGWVDTTTVYISAGGQCLLLHRTTFVFELDLVMPTVGKEGLLYGLLPCRTVACVTPEKKCVRSLSIWPALADVETETRVALLVDSDELFCAVLSMQEPRPSARKHVLRIHIASPSKNSCSGFLPDKWEISANSVAMAKLPPLACANGRVTGCIAVVTSAKDVFIVGVAAGKGSCVLQRFTLSSPLGFISITFGEIRPDWRAFSSKNAAHFFQGFLGIEVTPSPKGDSFDVKFRTAPERKKFKDSENISGVTLRGHCWGYARSTAADRCHNLVAVPLTACDDAASDSDTRVNPSSCEYFKLDL